MAAWGESVHAELTDEGLPPRVPFAKARTKKESREALAHSAFLNFMALVPLIVGIKTGIEAQETIPTMLLTAIAICFITAFIRRAITCITFHIK